MGIFSYLTPTWNSRADILYYTYKKVCVWEVWGGSLSPNHFLIAPTLFLLCLWCNQISKLLGGGMLFFREAGRLAANQIVTSLISPLDWLGKFPVLGVVTTTKMSLTVTAGEIKSVHLFYLSILYIYIYIY